MPSFFVSDCFHWINFHIVNHLLEKGYSVTGNERPLTDKQEHLAMMIGRNDLFSLISDDFTTEKYTHAILLNGIPDQIQNMAAIKMFKLTRETEPYEKGAASVIRIPLLFGEWMPMNEDGIYVDEQFIPFTSDTFQNEAVYIEDFIASLMVCLMSSQLPEKLKIRPKRSMSFGKEDDRQVIYLRERKSIDRQIKTLIAHYKRFKDFYTME